MGAPIRRTTRPDPASGAPVRFVPSGLVRSGTSAPTTGRACGVVGLGSGRRCGGCADVRTGAVTTGAGTGGATRVGIRRVGNSGIVPPSAGGAASDEGPLRAAASLRSAASRRRATGRSGGRVESGTTPDNRCTGESAGRMAIASDAATGSGAATSGNEPVAGPSRRVRTIPATEPPGASGVRSCTSSGADSWTRLGADIDDRSRCTGAVNSNDDEVARSGGR